MEKRDKGSENNSQKQTGKKRVAKPRQLGFEDTMTGMMVELDESEMSDEIKDMQSKFEDVIFSGTDYTDEQIKKNRINFLLLNGFTDEGIFLRSMDKNFLQNDGNKKGRLIKKNDIMNNVKFHESVKVACSVLDSKRIMSTMGIEQPVDLNEQTSIETFTASPDVVEQIKEHVCRLGEWEQKNPIATPEFNPAEDYFHYSPEHVEKASIGNEEYLACFDLEKDVIYIPIQHVINQSSIGYSETDKVVMHGVSFPTTPHMDNPGCIMIPMWLAELKHLV